MYRPWTRESRPDDDFSSVLSITTPYQALWCAVIQRAWADATGHVSERDIRVARNWPKYRSSDFELVCSLAGMNPEIIANAFKSPKPDDGPV